MEMSQTNQNQLIENKKSNRIEWIDIAKGIAMLCIIAGHMGIDSVYRVVFTFHIPIFFLISGYFITDKQSFRVFARKRVKSLVLPYAFTSFLLILAKVVLDLLKRDTAHVPTDALHVFIQALYGSGSPSNQTLWGIEPIGAIWFLLALLWALLLVRLFINQKLGWLWILLIAVASYVSSRFVWLPLDIQAGGTAALFVYIGAYIRKLNKHLIFKWWLVLIGFVVFAVEIILNIHVSVVSNTYNYTFVSIVGAVLISYSVLWLAKLLDHTKLPKKFLCFIGTNSIIILCFHLVELNNAPWNVLYQALGSTPLALQYLICFLCKLIFAIGCTLLTLRIKWLRAIFSK